VPIDRKESRVIYYSGYTGEETPRTVFIDGQEYPVDAILWRRRMLDRDSGRMMEIFGCKAAGRIIRIRKDEAGESEIF